MDSYNQLMTTDISMPQEQYISFMTEVIQSQVQPKSKLVPLDKVKGRNECGVMIQMNGSPHENRFLNINKQPDVLSSVRKVPAPDLAKSTGRDKTPREKYRTSPYIYYDTNQDVVKSNFAKVVPDFKLASGRREMPSNIEHLGYIDITKATQGYEYLSHSRKPSDITAFDKQLSRERAQVGTQQTVSTDYQSELPILEKVDFSDFLPNSINKKRRIKGNMVLASSFTTTAHSRR